MRLYVCLVKVFVWMKISYFVVTSLNDYTGNPQLVSYANLCAYTVVRALCVCVCVCVCVCNIHKCYQLTKIFVLGHKRQLVAQGQGGDYLQCPVMI